MTIQLLVTSRLGTVHAARYGHTCGSATNAARQVPISALQARVYKLGPCSSCWPHTSEFDRHIKEES